MEDETKDQYAERRKAEAIERLATGAWLFSRAGNAPLSPAEAFRSAEIYIAEVLKRSPDSKFPGL